MGPGSRSPRALPAGSLAGTTFESDLIPPAVLPLRMESLPRSLAQLRPELRSLLAQSYPKFSDAEYARRERLLAEMMARNEVDHLLLVTFQRVGTANEWIIAWPGWAETITVFQPGERSTAFIEYFNHLPLAEQMARNCEVQWAQQRGMGRPVEELKRRGARRIGVIGPLQAARWAELEAAFVVVGVDADYMRLRNFEKSDEEIDWFRIGCALSDAGLANLLEQAKPGMTEHDLADLVERGYVPHGGIHGIHFIGTTSMARPDLYVPRQFHSQRKLEPGDIVVCELSASFWGYSGQVLRSFTIEAEPTPLYRDLHATAEAAYAAITTAIRPGATTDDLLGATSIIEQNGFTTCDDVVHGYGGGYFQPIIGSRSRPAAPAPKMVLHKNMCLVVQPNVITRDRTAGVQTGEMVRVTKTGCESLHAAPRGLLRAGQIV
jgi:Xaa-Pro aminopeptidase